MNDVKRYDCQYDSQLDEIKCGLMGEDPCGDWVLSLDYDRLEAENKALRQHKSDYMEAAEETRRALEAENNAARLERDELRAELEALRSRVVVVPDEREAFEVWLHTFDFPPQLEGEIFNDPRYPDADCFGQFVYDDHSTQRCWAAWQARASLNGKTVSEKLLRALLDGDSNVSCVAANELRAILAE